MGRKQVRIAAQTSIQDAGIPYIGTVYPGRPVVMTEDAYLQTMNGQATQESENGSACVVVVNIIDDTTNRFMMVGRGARADFAKHNLMLELFFASIGGDGLAAQLDYDGIVDDLTTFIRENPTFAAPDVVWSAGEFSYGVKHQQTVPWTQEESDVVWINGTVRCEAWEQVMGTF